MIKSYNKIRNIVQKSYQAFQVSDEYIFIDIYTCKSLWQYSLSSRGRVSECNTHLVRSQSSEYACRDWSRENKWRTSYFSVVGCKASGQLEWSFERCTNRAPVHHARYLTEAPSSTRITAVAQSVSIKNTNCCGNTINSRNSRAIEHGLMSVCTEKAHTRGNLFNGPLSWITFELNGTRFWMSEN